MHTALELKWSSFCPPQSCLRKLQTRSRPSFTSFQPSISVDSVRNVKSVQQTFSSSVTGQKRCMKLKRNHRRSIPSKTLHHPHTRQAREKCHASIPECRLSSPKHTSLFNYHYHTMWSSSETHSQSPWCYTPSASIHKSAHSPSSQQVPSNSLYPTIPLV